MEHVEGTAAPAVTREEFQYDGFGNVTVHSEWGLVEDGDLLARGDERITTTTCLNDTASWLLGRASRVIVADAHGRREFETRTFYDGPAFVGLPLGGDRTWGMVSGPILVP